MTAVRTADDLRAAIHDALVRGPVVIDHDHPFQIGRTGGDRTPPSGLDADGRAEWFRKYDNGARYRLRPADGGQ